MDQAEIRAAALAAAAQLMQAGVLNGIGKTVPASPEAVIELARSFEKYISGPEFPQFRTPAVPIAESIQPEYLVCLEDGAKLKMLKRHLIRLGMTPEQYRERWGLPDDYPMTAPNYSSQRSNLAKQIGLGVNSRGRPARVADDRL